MKSSKGHFLRYALFIRKGNTEVSPFRLKRASLENPPLYDFKQVPKTMKRAIFTLFAIAFVGTAFGWGTVGHKIAIAIAQRHLTERAKANIAKYIDYDLKEDAVWMDKHRHDEPIAYTTHYHVFATDKNLRYDPNYRIAEGGDVVFSLALSDYNLASGHYKEMTDSAVVMNIRMIIHFMADMHCPVHTHVEGVKTIWKCKFGGKEWERFHPIYDKIPARIYDKSLSYDQIAEQLDTASKKEIKKVVAGSIIDWANDAARVSTKIYDINPMYAYDMDPETDEKSRAIIDTQLRNSGYRLAAKLNEYFDY